MTFGTIEMSRTARMVVEEAAAVQPLESVCIVTDTNKLPIADALAHACHAVGAETVICIMTPRHMHGNELPPVVAGAMRAADVILAPTTYAITHTAARRAASQAGARTVIMRGIEQDTFVHGAMTADYKEIHRVTTRLAEALSAASRIHMTSPPGSDITMSVEGRQALVLGGTAHERGSITTLPSGEAAIVPVEGSAEGVLVVDHAFDGLGLLESPITIAVERGVAVRIEGGRDAQRLQALLEGVENSTNIAEFAIGTNPRSRMLGNLAEDKILRGCVHMAVGDNHTIGGAVQSEIHLDGVVLRPTVTLDGREIVRQGQLLSS
jgi:leucyl aminopeptidase (aminopeptidase T)